MSTPPQPAKKRGRPIKNLPLRDEHGELVVTIEYATHWPEAKQRQFSQVARMLYLRWFSNPSPPTTSTTPTKDTP